LLAVLRAVEDAAAALHTTAALLMQRLHSQAAVLPLPRATLGIYEVAGVACNDHDVPAQTIRLLDLLAATVANLAIDKPATMRVFAPLQLAGWDAAALPAELQPYEVHFKAALLLWWV
jgi:hypothetical protein